ncbi:stage II sporulation protein M [Streptomyces sp. NPDC059063]|uniref:stage II sporulation protein M n=1 Tax=unclassified Streptomyces TaxID=2593676 RepID=UPI0036B7DCC0
MTATTALTATTGATAGLFRRQWPALVSGALLWLAAFGAGWWYAPTDPTGVSRAPKQGDWGLFTEILARNVGVSAALFLGVVTLGVMTIPLTLVTGTLAGYFWGQGSAVLSTGEIVRHLLPHMPLELACLALAAAAGLVPLVTWARAGLGRRPAQGTERGAGRGTERGAEQEAVRGGRFGFQDACLLWGVSVAGLIVAAGIETWVST